MLLKKGPVAVLGVACMLLCVTGCGKSKGKVSGKVTLEGKALRFGTVTMAGTDGVAIKADIQPDGTYSLTGVTFGKVSVSVTSPDPNPPDPFANMPPGFKHPMNKGKDMPKPAAVDNTGWFPIPGEYGSLSQSGLSFNLNQKEMTFDIEMKEKEKAPGP